MRDFYQVDIRRGAYINVITGRPVRVYKLNSGLYYADPFTTFREGELPEPLTGKVARNLLRLEPSKIQKLIYDTRYADDPISPEFDFLPARDIPFRSHSQSRPVCVSPVTETAHGADLTEGYIYDGKGPTQQLSRPSHLIRVMGERDRPITPLFSEAEGFGHALLGRIMGEPN